MVSQQSRTLVVQFAIGFIVPTIVLLSLSAPEKLGSLGAMALALAFPVALELYGLVRRRKPSVMSLVAIVGILLIGVISVLGLSKEWLAVRRSGLYALAAVGLLLVVRFRPSLIEKGLDRILEMEGVRVASKRRNTETQLMASVRRAGYALAIILAIVAAVSYVMTIVVITAPTGSSGFNTQYAELRMVSLFVVTVPFIIALTAIMVYLVGKFEVLTGVDAEAFIKKRPPEPTTTEKPDQKGRHNS